MSSLCVAFNPFRIFCVSVELISGAIAISIILYGIYKSCSHRKLQMLKPFLITYYTTCLLWVIAIVGYILFQLTPYNKAICSNFTLINSVFGVSMGFCGYLFGLIGIYSLFLLRLKYSFQDSVLQLSNIKYYILISGIFIQIILVSITAYYYIIFRWDIGLILSYSSIIVNTIYSLALLVLFLRNICRLQKHLRFTMTQRKKVAYDHMNNTSKIDTNTKNINQTISVSGINNVDDGLISVSSTKESTETIHSHHKYNNLAEMTVKFAICSAFTFISTIIINFMSFYRGLIVEDTFDLLMFHVTLNVVDCMVTVICLHLQFSYSIWIYLKLCKCFRLKLKSYVLSIFDEPNVLPLQLQIKTTSEDKESGDKEIELPELHKSVTTMSGTI